MLLRHILSILVLPFTVTIAVPAALVHGEKVLPLGPAELGGIPLIMVGLVLVVLTIHHFATVGRGTLAPWDPPRHLVIRGVYRHVRNPMISGVLLIVLGESVLLASRAVGLWAATVLAINAIYIPLIEEPDLDHRFGEDYDLYKRHVPRWLPRVTPWVSGREDSPRA
jgi:protein-S-isoprenylcysteine O-methyltransferase Ste14